MNRREFIKTGAGAFFVAAAGSAFGAGAASNRVRLAIVGCHENGRGFQVMKSAMKVPGVERDARVVGENELHYALLLPLRAIDGTGLNFLICKMSQGALKSFLSKSQVLRCGVNR